MTRPAAQVCSVGVPEGEGYAGEGGGAHTQAL
jgi:hypothetical protein